MTMEIERLSERAKKNGQGEIASSLKSLARTAEAMGIPREFPAPPTDIPTEIEKLAREFISYNISPIIIPESLKNIADTARSVAAEQARRKEAAKKAPVNSK